MRSCPFCEMSGNEIIKQNEFAFMILAQAPYVKDHLLIIPKRHVMKLNKMSAKEKDAVEKLIYYGMKKLHKRHRNVTVLYKEGRKKEVGKSVDHLHYHLIPDMQIGKNDVDWRRRKIIDEDKYVKMVERFRKRK